LSLIEANHDVNKGGFIITIAEMCFKNNIGVEIDLNNFSRGDLNDDELLFSESAGRFIIETSKSNSEKILELSKKNDIQIHKIGTTIADPKIQVSGLRANDFTLNLKKLKNLYDSTIPNLMDI
jgi:phosphoribosylformylglycinamidine synthase